MNKIKYGDYLEHPLKDILIKRKLGIPSYCTANKIVLETILEYYLPKEDYVLIECTANQVNQFGGYTNMTPIDFVEYVYNIADKIGFPRNRLILGADHFGPLVWADKSEKEAMQNAKDELYLQVANVKGRIMIKLEFDGKEDTFMWS